MDLDTGFDLDSFVRLVGAAVFELAVADDVAPNLVDVHFFYGSAFRRHVHRKTGQDVFGRRRLMVKRHDRHQMFPFAELDSISVWEFGFRHLKPRSDEKQGLAWTGDAGSV